MTDSRRQQFSWHSFDVSGLLPANWDDLIVRFALANAVEKTIVPTSITSREGSDVESLKALTVGGERIRKGLPWLWAHYASTFRELGQRCTLEEVALAQDDRYAVNLNVQRGPHMRYEAHIDSNPLEGLLYVTTHSPGTGGELVVGNVLDVVGLDAIDADCTRVYPSSGHLVFFDARHHAHYVAPLLASDAVRVVVAMNFYTPTCPESARPADLNRHLGLE